MSLVADEIYMKIMKELDYPPIFLIPPKQFAMLEGEKNKADNSVSIITWGLAAIRYPVITAYPYIHGKELENTLWHEVGHHLFPDREHWWIDLFGEAMARGGGRGAHAAEEGKTPDDIPSRDKLLRMARSRARKLKKQYRTSPLS